jgi:hypothetical protein
MARTTSAEFEKAYKKATYLQNASNDDMLDVRLPLPSTTSSIFPKALQAF